MLIIYRKVSREVVHNSGTNSFLPEGPPFDIEVQNVIQTHGGTPEDYDEFRLHDIEQMALVQKCFTHSYTLEFNAEGEAVDIIFGDPLQTPVPEPQPPSLDERLEAVEMALLDLAGI